MTECCIYGNNNNNNKRVEAANYVVNSQSLGRCAFCLISLLVAVTCVCEAPLIRASFQVAAL